MTMAVRVVPNFDDLVEHCCVQLHESYKDRSAAYTPFAKSDEGIKCNTRRDVETILRAASMMNRSAE